MIGGYAPTFEGDVAVIPVEIREPLAAEHDAFLRRRPRWRPPVVDVEDGLWAVAIANALLSAAAERPTPSTCPISLARLPVA